MLLHQIMYNQSTFKFNWHLKNVRHVLYVLVIKCCNVLVVLLMELHQFNENKLDYISVMFCFVIGQQQHILMAPNKVYVRCSKQCYAKGFGVGHPCADDFFSVRLVSVLRGHSVFSSPPQRPMTSDFEGFSIPDFIHYIFSLS